MGSVIRALVVLAILAAPAAAEKPKPPDRWLGWSLRMGVRDVRGGHRTEADFGLHLGGVHWGQLRFGLEYDFLIVEEDDAERMMVVGHGVGHRGTALAAYPIWYGYSDRMHISGYLSLEGGAAFTLIHDSYTGREAEAAGMFGVRFGYELFAKDHTPSNRLADYISMRWLVTPGAGVGWLFGVSMEWGD